MKRTFLFMVIAVLAVALVTGCGGAKDGKEEKKEQGKVSIGSLFDKGKKAEGMSFDYVLTSAQMKLEGKYWISGEKLKSETVVDGKTSIFIVDGKAVYVYDPGENKATKMAVDSATKQAETPNDYIKKIDEKVSSIKGTEVYDGVACKVIVMNGIDGKEQMRMLVREDYGIPVKVEVTDPTGAKTVIEYKNLKVGKISDDVFKLPSGVTVVDINELMNQAPQTPSN